MKNSFELIQDINQENVIFALKCQTIYFIYMFLATKLLPGKMFKGFPDPKGKIL